jgi:hypothetical protein
MNNTPRIEGTPDPRDLGKLGQKDSLNTEKFKKILRVDKSDESEQKNKRNLKKSEEGEDDEVEESDEVNTPQTLFSELMQGHQKTTSLFDVQGGKEQALTANEDTKPASSAYSPMAKTLPPPYKMIAEQSSQTPTIKEEGINLTTNENSNDPKNQSDTKKSKKKEEETKISTFIKGEKKVDKKEEPPTQFSLSKDESPTSAKTATPQIEKTKEPVTVILEKSSQISKEAEESASMSIEVPKPIQSEPIGPSSEIDVTSLQKGKKPTLEDSNEEKEESESRAKKEKEGAKENIHITPDTPSPMINEAISIVETPAYASLSPNLFELFEQMVGLITIEHSNKGVSTTRIKLSMPGSIFHECEIQLEHYDTAPHSFNIQLLGTPAAIKTFSSNISKLVASFDEQKYPFSVNIQSPSLLKEEQPLFKRKENTKNDQF